MNIQLSHQTNLYQQIRVHFNLRAHTALTWLGLCLLSLGLLLCATDVQAENTDRDQPIELEADSVLLDDAKGISTYIGNVILTQGSLVIRAEKMSVSQDQDGFQYSVCHGEPTTFRQKRFGKDEYIEGGGQRIEYNGRLDKVKLFTGAWVKRGEDVINGDYISYDANAEYAEVIGGNKKNVAGSSNGRVKAVIQPKNRTAPNVTSTPEPTRLRLNRTLNMKPQMDESP